MPMIDERGRLFGKVNLIDAAFVLVCLLLIPIGYGAYALFRTPIPHIISVEPARLVQGQDLTVQIWGEHLRPFLRAAVGNDMAKGFLIESPSRAEVKLPSLPPGMYDLILYDESRELARQRDAVTIVSPPLPPVPPPPPPPPSFVVQVLGKFAGLEKDAARDLSVGSRLSEVDGGPAVADVLALQAREPAVQAVRINPATVIPTLASGRVQVPAILRLRCALVTDGCRLGGALVARDVPISLFRGTEALSFVIEEIRSADAPVAFPSAPSAPTAVVQVLGKFAGLDVADVPALRVGSRFPEDGTAPVAEVLAVQAAEPAQQRVRVGGNVTTTPVAGKLQIPAILRLWCTLANDGCHVGEAVTAPDVVLSLPRRKDEVAKFVVEEVRSADAPAAFFSPKTATAELLVRFVVRPEVFSLVKAGDKAASSSSPSPFLVGRRESATLTSIGKEQVLRSLVSIELDPSPIRAHQVEQQVTAFEATVRAPVHETLNGWQHNGEPVKIGAVFSFETPLYIMRGWILRVNLPSARAEAQPPSS